MTYSKSAFAFDRDTALSYLAMISFVHRSFQEYFCALFVSSAPAGFVKKFLDEGSFRVYDDVLPMLFGMVPERVEAEWARDAVNDILKNYDSDDAQSVKAFATACCPKIEMSVSKSGLEFVSADPSLLGRIEQILSRFYLGPFDKHDSQSDQMEEWTEEIHRRWEDALAAELIRIEDLGHLDLNGFRATWDGRSDVSERKTFTIRMDDRCWEFMRIAFDDTFYGNLKAIEEIGLDQSDRAGRSDEFLRSVFDP